MFINNKYTNIYFRLIERARTRIISGYVEKHHIISRSLGGGNEPSNIVKLTAREHFICHRLLTKMVLGHARHLMCVAVYYMMLVTGTRREPGVFISSRTIELLRQERAQALSALTKGKPKNWSVEGLARLSELARGRPSGNKGHRLSKAQKEHLSKINKGKITSPETGRKISEANTGKKRTEESKARISAALMGRTGRSLTAEEKAHLSIMLKGRPSPMRGKTPWNKGIPRSFESRAKMSKSHQNRPMIECANCGKVVPKPNFARWHGDRCRVIAELP